MLFYKAWWESRVRFLLVLSALVVFSLGFLLEARVHFPPPQVPMLPYAAYVWSTFYAQWGTVAFSIVALVLGLGGLQRERAAGTVALTLALPVSRVQLLMARAAVGVLELAVFAVVPAAIVPTLSPVLVHQSYPATQCLHFAVLFMSWGVVWFGAGFLWSILFTGDYTAAVASVLTPFAYLVVYANLSRGGRRFPSAANPFAFMSGNLDVDPGGFSRGLLTRPLPWETIALLGLVTMALLVAGWRFTERQNF
jgi:ABC-type transport system involved in multi-copper enzyme maturation permease subunit